MPMMGQNQSRSPQIVDIANSLAKKEERLASSQGLKISAHTQRASGFQHMSGCGPCSNAVGTVAMLLVLVGCECWVLVIAVYSQRGAMNQGRHQVGGINNRHNWR